MKRPLMPQGWMSGSCGKPGEGGKSVGRDEIVSRAFPSLFFCMLYGDTPVPESCAQRTVEGDGSHLL